MTTEFDSNESPPLPIAHKWFDFPEHFGVRRMVSLYDDGTVSLIDSCPDTKQVLGFKFDIPMTRVNPFLFSALWSNVTSEDLEVFKVRHAQPEQIKEAAWLLGSE
jgi:hypothetical protein